MLILKDPLGSHDHIHLYIHIWVKLHSLPIRKSEVWPHQHQFQFSACVTPYINNAPHVRRHSCGQPGPARFVARCIYVCVCGSMCGVKGAIHEQLAGVKSGKGMEPCCL